MNSLEMKKFASWAILGHAQIWAKYQLLMRIALDPSSSDK